MTSLCKSRFDVSPRMQVFLGMGAMPDAPEIRDAIQLAFALGGERRNATVTIGDCDQAADTADLVFRVEPGGAREVIGDVPDGDGCWYLSTEQRAIARSVLDCTLPEPAGRSFQTAKAIELLCLVTVDLRRGTLPSADGNGALSESDAQRILSARRMIDERWHEKLTIDMIGRACGLNRARLTKGFRAVFDCSIGDAIVERRLSNARHMLLVTDLPISSIGYACGYYNNASFTRAFAKRFGVVPTRLRARTAERVGA